MVATFDEGEKITTKYVIGADTDRVRRSPTGHAPKVSIGIHIPPTTLSRVIYNESTADGVCRIGFTIPEEDDPPPTLLDVDYFQKPLDER